MYLVLFGTSILGGLNCSKCTTLDEAREVIKNLYESGQRNVILTQEVPLSIEVTVKF